MPIKRLQIELLDQKLEPYQTLAESVTPDLGWIRFIRQSIGMSMRQLGARLGMTAQSVADLENREFRGSVSLNALREAAEALDMKVVYAIVPKHGTVGDMVRTHARKLAEDAVRRTSISMSLEDQTVSRDELLREVDYLADDLIRKGSRTFWNQIPKDR